MKRNPLRRAAAAFTLVEISVALSVMMIVGGLAYSMLMTSTTLLAKNLSLNSSNTSLRSALDRIYSEINQANGLPKLINADGSAVSSSGPAAGIIFDRYVSGPFVVGNPGSGLPANTTSFKLFYSTDPLANPIPPIKNDVVLMDGVTRALVSSCSAPTGYSAPIPSPTPVTGKMVTVTLQASLGTAISWSANLQQTAYVVHRKAFVVVPVSGRSELRMYADAETVTDYNDSSRYAVLSRDIGNQPGDNTPFAIVTADTQGHILGANFLSIAMRVEDQQFNKYLAKRQSKEFNTFLQVDTRLRPRNFLK